MSRAFEQPLYHGTVEMIPRIDVTRGRFKKDFGRGFYLALQPRQAVGMMHSCLCTEKAVEVGVMAFGPVDWRMYE